LNIYFFIICLRVCKKETYYLQTECFDVAFLIGKKILLYESQFSKEFNI